MDDYQTIFGPPASADAVPLADQLDTLITSVGSFNEGWEEFKDEMSKVGVPTARLREVAVGDLGGVLLPKRTPSAAEQAKVHAAVPAIAGTWTGLTLAQCQRIARQAVHTERPGVVVVAIGASKKEMVLAGVEQGLINALIIDHDLAMALGNMLA
jgi:DNA-binding transcriptional regulator LsrR (DeoR family)